jgi:hypothetical protein
MTQLNIIDDNALSFNNSTNVYCDECKHIGMVVRLRKEDYFHKISSTEHHQEINSSNTMMKEQHAVRASA